MAPKTNVPDRPMNQDEKIRKENEEFTEFDLPTSEVDDNPAGLIDDKKDDKKDDNEDHGCGCS